MAAGPERAEGQRPERRQCARVEVMGFAIVLSQGRYVGTYLIENLSASGALLLGDTSLPVGNPVRLLIQLQNGCRRLSVAAAIVRHAVRGSQKAFAVQFFRVPSVVEHALHSAVSIGLREAETRSVALVVHPSEEQAALLARDLAELGCITAPVHCLMDAIVWLQSSAPCAAIVVADQVHPHVDGFALLEFIGVDHPRVRRVLACSGPADGAWRDAIAYGCVDALLETPWTAASLRSALGRGP